MNTIMKGYLNLTFLLLTVAFFTENVFAQKNTEEGNIAADKLLDCQTNWAFYKLTDTLEMKVIQHNVATAGCGTIAFAALTIGKVGLDTVRILELCNTNKIFIKDQIVKVIPAEKPTFQVSLPISLYINASGELQCDKYSLTIFRTAYGQLVEK
jgi:hypothetical protein